MPECVHGPEVHYKIVLLMFLLNCEMLHTIIDRAYDYKTALQLECIPDNVALFFSSFAKAKGCTFTWTWTDVPHPRQEDGRAVTIHQTHDSVRITIFDPRFGSYHDFFVGISERGMKVARTCVPASARLSLQAMRLSYFKKRFYLLQYVLQWFFV